MNYHRDALSYVLITPARNEEAFIEKTIQSVVRQTVLPSTWVIIDDGSTDSTAEIVSRYLSKYSWMQMVQRSRRLDRNFAAKVYAFNAGYEKVKSLQHEVIGNLDADITFPEDYCEFLLSKFQENADLGVAGTIFKEQGLAQKRTVSKDMTTLLAVASCFEGSALRKLEDMSQTNREG